MAWASGRMAACLNLSPAPAANPDMQHRSFKKETDMPITQPTTIRMARAAAMVWLGP